MTKNFKQFFFTTMEKQKRAHNSFFIKIEKHLSNTFLKYAYINFFDKATIEEFGIVEIQPNHKILHIGCGSLPNTLVSLARFHNANFVGIDIDNESITNALTLIKKYNLTNVKIEYGDALDYPLNNFDTIIISYGVEPKQVIFKRLIEETSNDVSIIYRKQWDFLDFIYGEKNIIPNGLKIVRTHKRRDFIKTYLLKKV